eukprot:364888-Chlamydomonas_euryale.AAC.7
MEQVWELACVGRCRGGGETAAAAAAAGYRQKGGETGTAVAAAGGYGSGAEVCLYGMDGHGWRWVCVNSCTEAIAGRACVRTCAPGVPVVRASIWDRDIQGFTQCQVRLLLPLHACIRFYAWLATCLRHFPPHWHIFTPSQSPSAPQAQPPLGTILCP